MAWMEELCGIAALGRPMSEPTVVSGGLLHRMFRLETSMGVYAVKLLNPEIMARPGVLDNYRRAEALESLLEQKALPILAAMTANGRKMLRLGEQYVYVFPWFEGQMIRGSAVTAAHAAAIGATLAGIHTTASRERTSLPEPLTVDWDALLPACPELAKHRDLLVRLTDRSNEAQLRLPSLQTVCHNDLDTKNVLWLGDAHRVIDLETLDWGCPHAELLETALYWSGIEEHRIDTARFRAFVSAYRAAGGVLPRDWNVLMDSDQGRLGWLAWVLEQGDAAQARDTVARILCVEDFRACLLQL